MQDRVGARSGERGARINRNRGVGAGKHRRIVDPVTYG